MLKIIKASEPIAVTQLVVTLYGAPGVGKSTMGFTADSPLLLDFDRGSYRAANRKDVVPIETWDDVLHITAEDIVDYRTIIVDTAGRALDCLTAHIIKRDPKKGRGGVLTLQGYGTLKAEFVAWMKSLQQLGKDVVLLAHMDESRSGDEIVERIDVQGGSKGEIYKASDAMGRIAIRDGRRILTFSPTDTAFGKNPGQLTALDVPDAALDPFFLRSVLVAIKAKLNELTEEQRVAQQAVLSYADEVAKLETAEAFTAEAKRLAADGAPRTQKAILANTAKQKGFWYDKQHECFQAPAEAQA